MYSVAPRDLTQVIRPDSKFLSLRLARDKCTFKRRIKDPFVHIQEELTKGAVSSSPVLVTHCCGHRDSIKAEQCALAWGFRDFSHGREVGRWICYIHDAGSCGELLIRSERTARETGLGYSTSGPVILVHFSQADSASQRCPETAPRSRDQVT